MSTAFYIDVCGLSRLCGDSAANFSDFAVGYSRQPLPKGKSFVALTKADDVRIKATDAVVRYGFEQVKLRPELLDARMAKLPPTATIFSKNAAENQPFMNNSAPKEARIGLEKITNGVKQQLPSAWLLGGEIFYIAAIGDACRCALAN